MYNLFVAFDGMLVYFKNNNHNATYRFYFPYENESNK